METFIAISIILGPIIICIVSFIVDSIKDNINDNKYKKYYGEKELFYITTYQNKNVSEQDIMQLFIMQINKYNRRQTVSRYEIYKEKEKQNYAWSIRTTKQKFGWGIIYNINFHFTNGYFLISFSDKEFRSGDNISFDYFAPGNYLMKYFLEKITRKIRRLFCS